MITVLDIASLPSEVIDGARRTAFLTDDTVGAQKVRGEMYSLDPGARIGPSDATGEYQLFYVTEGAATASRGGQTHELGPGQGVYCDPSESCSIENTATKPAKLFRFVVTQEDRHDAQG
jgi:quercetin dioxygenase-like cupin family protein